MAGSKEAEMPVSSTNPDIEWSTREKLAIASYVMRSGEQRWSGAGRLLRPLGEPGRPFDWFSPKYCAQQYTALMVQADAPKRKRGDRSDSSENVQPVVPPEDAIIARLTKERIEELKKQVRDERTEYRKLKRDIEMIESGGFDDRLDDLLKEIKNTDRTEKESESAKEDETFNKTSETAPEIDETVTEMTDSQQVVSKDDMESEEPVLEKKNLEAKVEEEEKDDTFMEALPPKVDEMPENMETNPPDSFPESIDTQPMAEEESVEAEVEPPHPEEEMNILKAAEIPSVPVSETVPADEANSQDESQKTDEKTNNEVELSLSEKTSLPVDDSESTVEASQVVNEVDNTVSHLNDENFEKQEEAAVPESQPIKDETTPSETVTSQESENLSIAQNEEEIKQYMSRPSTPAPAGNFAYDSTFPSSPALSHSSDVDPETAANLKAWRKSIMILWKQVASHRYASIFLQPVTDEIAPNYSTTVYRSTDLATIKKNIENGVIRTTSEFRRDIMLMFQNALMYNSAEHDVYIWTLEMQKDFLDQIAQFIATQMMVETAQPPENKSLRRSTMRRSALIEKSNQNTRSRRSAVSDTDTKSNH